MAIATVGVRVRGRIERPDGSTDATRFLCVSELPVLPIEGLRFVDDGAEQRAPLRPASVLLAYWWGWGWLATVSLALMAFVWSPTEPLPLVVMAEVTAIVLVGLYPWSLWRARVPRRILTALLLLTIPTGALALGFWIDLRDRVELQLRRCDAGLLDQCVAAGRRYEDGNDVHRNRLRARALYTRACEGHFAAACTALARMKD